jgi:hypothetical protein
VRDNGATDRERLRAAELLATLAHKGLDVAMYVDKNLRLDSGKPTDRMELSAEERSEAKRILEQLRR